MPIYAYKCASCGHAKDVLQKISDAPLTQCPACGADTFGKQVTAAGFQLKGSGWYVTDFRNGGGAAKPTDAKVSETSKPADTSATSSSDTAAKPAETATKPAPKSDSSPAASAGEHRGAGR